MCSKRSRADSGVTLAELLFALLFTCMAVLAVLGVSTYTARAATASRERRQASLLASSLAWRTIERLGEDFDDTSLEVALPPGQPASPELDPEGRFLYGLDITSVGTAPAGLDELKQIRVTVTWKSDRGPQSYVLTTRVAR